MIILKKTSKTKIPSSDNSSLTPCTKSFRSSICANTLFAVIMPALPNFFLISCEENSEINLKKISKSLNLGNVSFAKKEYLNNCLGIKPGSVSPFALLNDKKDFVSFFLEDRLYKSEILNFHPLINSLTISIAVNDFVSFMIENNKKIHIFSSADYKILKTYE